MNVTWEEDPDHFADICHCRAFFPTGSIDWTWNYTVEYSGPDDLCTASDGGHLEAGVGLSNPEDQMLVLFEDRAIPKSIFSMSGAVPGEAFLNCDGGFTMPITDFIAISAPDEISTATPEPLGEALPAGPTLPPADSTFKIRPGRREFRAPAQRQRRHPFDPYDYDLTGISASRWSRSSSHTASSAPRSSRR